MSPTRRARRMPPDLIPGSAAYVALHAERRERLRDIFPSYARCARCGEPLTPPQGGMPPFTGHTPSLLICMATLTSDVHFDTSFVPDEEAVAGLDPERLAEYIALILEAT